jgi:hypothetical protein
MAKNDRKRRPTRKLLQQKRFLVVVEGDVTEREYIDAVKRSRRIRNIDIQIVHRYTDPVGIVNDAKEQQKLARKSDPYDEVWCVFDTETKLTQPARHGLSDAINAAKAAKVECAISNPCVELWLLWHYRDQNSWISSDGIQHYCRELKITQEGRGKHLSDADDLIGNRYAAAKERAEAADTRHQQNGNRKPEDRNPSSGMYKLIDAIYAAFPLRS